MAAPLDWLPPLRLSEPGAGASWAICAAAAAPFRWRRPRSCRCVPRMACMLSHAESHACMPKALQVCSLHAMFTVPCMLPCVHAPGPAGAPAACHACHAGPVCMPPPCMHAWSPPPPPRSCCTAQGRFNCRVSVGGSSPMQQPLCPLTLTPMCTAMYCLYCTGWLQQPRVGGRLVANAAAAAGLRGWGPRGFRGLHAAAGE